MRKRGGLLSIIIVLGALMIAANIIPILIGIAGLLIPICGVALVVFIIALLVSTLKGNGKTKEAPVDKAISIGGVSGGKLNAEQLKLIQDANSAIFKARYSANKINDAELRNAVVGVLDKADRVLKVLKEQPEEIRKANQFFSYYLPTIQVVMDKYKTLEGSGQDSKEYLTKVLGFLNDTSKAFDNLFEAMFKDEKLDLEVEVEAMQMALKRDGLV